MSGTIPLKDKKIAAQKATIASLKEELHTAHVDLSERQGRVDHLDDELAECARMNDRLNKTIKAEREKIGTLKEVARFFRAQRDRVDSYLSATLDAGDRDRNKGYNDYPVETASPLTPVGLVETGPKDRRPRINEPGSMSDGRDYAGYRDKEPHNNWESF